MSRGTFCYNATTGKFYLDPPHRTYLKAGSPDRHYMTGTGQEIRGIHPRSRCRGQACVIHNPSDHSMRSFPTLWRSDWGGFMERLCPHGVGHPDPDDPNAHPIHGCDGCCSEEEVPASGYSRIRSASVVDDAGKVVWHSDGRGDGSVTFIWGKDGVFRAAL